MKIWPKDWDLHIIKSSEILFDTSDNPVEFLNARSKFSTMILPGEFLNTNFEELLEDQLSTLNTTLYTLYCYNMKYYHIIFSWSISGHVLGKVLWKKVCFNGVHPLVEDIELSPSEIIGFLKGESSFDCCEKIKNIIINHNRGDNDDREYYPNDCPDPVNTLDLQPI